MGGTSRSLPSIARIWDVPCVGFRNRTCSSAHATAEPTMRTVHTPPDLRLVGCFRTVTELWMANSSSKQAKYPQPVVQLRRQPERDRNARDQENRPLARSA